MCVVKGFISLLKAEVPETLLEPADNFQSQPLNFVNGVSASCRSFVRDVCPLNYNKLLFTCFSVKLQEAFKKFHFWIG